MSKAHLGFDAGELSRLFSRVNQEVGADLDHGRRVVVHSVLLKLDHVLPQVLLDVALQLWKAAGAGCEVQFYNKPPKEFCERLPKPELCIKPIKPCTKLWSDP